MYQLQMQDYVTKNEFKQSMEDIGQNFRLVFAKLDEHDQRFEAIDRRFDAVDRRFDGIDSRLDAMDLRFNRLDHNIAVIIRHLDIPESQVAI